LANVFLFQFGVLALQVRAIREGGESLEHTPDGQAHVADAWLAVHAGRVGGDAVQIRHGIAPAS
jgi:hypothetical protein